MGVQGAKGMKDECQGKAQGSKKWTQSLDLDLDQFFQV